MKTADVIKSLQNVPDAEVYWAVEGCLTDMDSVLINRLGASCDAYALTAAQLASRLANVPDPDVTVLDVLGDAYRVTDVLTVDDLEDMGVWEVLVDEGFFNADENIVLVDTEPLS